MTLKIGIDVGFPFGAAVEQTCVFTEKAIGRRGLGEGCVDTKSSLLHELHPEPAAEPHFQAKARDLFLPKVLSGPEGASPGATVNLVRE